MCSANWTPTSSAQSSSHPEMENWAPKHYEARQADITNRMKFWPSRIAIDFAECLSLGRPSRSIVIYYLGNGGGRRALSLGHRRRCINLMLCARHPFWRRATRARVVRRGYRCRNNQWTTDGRPYPSTQNNALLENKGNKQAKSGPQMARRHGRRPATLSGMPKHDSAIK